MHIVIRDFKEYEKTGVSFVEDRGVDCDKVFIKDGEDREWSLKEIIDKLIYLARKEEGIIK